MRKSKAQQAASGGRATLKPARQADAELDHLEHMITSFTNASDPAPLGCLDRAYWRRRLSTLTEESDLVSAQRARVIKLMDLLEQAGSETGPSQAAA